MTEMEAMRKRLAELEQENVRLRGAGPAAVRRFVLLCLAGAGVVLVFFVSGYWLMSRSPANATVAGEEPAAAPAAPKVEMPAPRVEAPGRPAIAMGGGGGRAISPVVATPGNGNLPALHGGIGLGTWDTTAEFKDILVQTSDQKTLMQCDFANGAAGWVSEAGQWDGAQGVLTQSSRAIGCKTTTGDAGWSDYTYSLKARRTDGTEGFLVIFAAQSRNSFTWWNIGGWGNTRLSIEKTTNGGKREIPGTAVDLRIEPNTWYDIKIELRGETVNCYMDGKLITTVENGIGHSTLSDAGPPQVVNNGNGPVPVVRTPGRATVTIVPSTRGVVGTRRVIGARGGVAVANPVTGGTVQNVDQIKNVFTVSVTAANPAVAGGQIMATRSIDDKTRYVHSGRPSTMDEVLQVGHVVTFTPSGAGNGTAEVVWNGQ